MTKRIESKHKIDRRLGVNLWGRPKSPLNTRAYGPGQHGQRQPPRALAQPGAQAPVGQWRLGDGQVPGRHHHARMPVCQAARLGDRQPAARLIPAETVFQQKKCE